MICAIAILTSSTALFFFYIQAHCQHIFRREFLVPCFHVTRYCLALRHLVRFSETESLFELTAILHYCANLIGERVDSTAATRMVTSQ